MAQATADITDIVARAKRNDREALADLYRLAVKPVYRYLAARVRDIETAEELTQEVFLGALAGIGGLRATNEPGLFAWLFRIARHKLADHLRRRGRFGVPLDEALGLEAGGASPEALAERQDEARRVREALELLTPDQREVLLYKYVLDYDNQQAAALLGKTANAVNQLHHRALASLHRRLEAPGCPPAGGR